MRGGAGRERAGPKQQVHDFMNSVKEVKTLLTWKVGRGVPCKKEAVLSNQGRRSPRSSTDCPVKSRHPPTEGTAARNESPTYGGPPPQNIQPFMGGRGREELTCAPAPGSRPSRCLGERPPPTPVFRDQGRPRKVPGGAWFTQRQLCVYRGKMDTHCFISRVPVKDSKCSPELEASWGSAHGVSPGRLAATGGALPSAPQTFPGSADTQVHTKPNITKQKARP